MANSSSRASQWQLKSERVVQLLSACIRTTVRLRYGRELSIADATDLARVHDLPSAMKHIADKLELHQNLPDSHTRFMLAINEAKLVSDAELGTETILSIREASIATIESKRSASSEHRSLLVGLRVARGEANSWANAYTRFLSEIENLYKLTKRELDSLHLVLDSRLRAEAELEKIILDAVTRAGEI